MNTKSLHRAIYMEMFLGEEIKALGFVDYMDAKEIDINYKTNTVNVHTRILSSKENHYNVFIHNNTKFDCKIYMNDTDLEENTLKENKTTSDLLELKNCEFTRINILRCPMVTEIYFEGKFIRFNKRGE